MHTNFNLNEQNNNEQVLLKWAGIYEMSTEQKHKNKHQQQQKKLVIKFSNQQFLHLVYLSVGLLLMKGFLQSSCGEGKSGVEATGKLSVKCM